MYKKIHIKEKMYDFEQNKRNNLIFYGVPQEPRENSELLRYVARNIHIHIDWKGRKGRVRRVQ